MSSNKYFREWKESNSDNSYKVQSHQSVLNKLEKDIKRLDRAIDKIENEEKAKKIFDLGKQMQSQSQSQILTQTQILTPIYPYPVYYSPIAHAGPQYVIINGCLVLCQNNI